MYNLKLAVKCKVIVLFSILSFSAGQSNIENSTDWKQINLFHYPNASNITERYNITDQALFKDAKFKRGKRVKLIVHGANSNCMKDGAPYDVLQAYLRVKASGREDYTVLCLDYGPLAGLGRVPGTPIPTVTTRFEYVCDIVSEKLSNLILALKNDKIISSFADVHIIGHSLGGQVSGYTGRKIQEKTNYRKKLGRITGLDIMNIFLVYSGEVNLQNQLDLSDGHFVDIVHTSPIGLKGNYGHVDFYPDGGLHQKSCLTKGPISNVTEILIGGCSHTIVGKYWANSIDNPNITACRDVSWESYSNKESDKCSPEDTVIFGEYVPVKARGRYFLNYPLLMV